MRVRVNVLPMTANPKFLTPECPRCLQDVVSVYVIVPKKWSRYLTYFLTGNKVHPVELQLNPCGHVITGEAIEAYAKRGVEINGISAPADS